MFIVIYDRFFEELTNIQNVHSLDFHTSGMYMATAGIDATIDLWDPKKGVNLKSFNTQGTTITKIKFSSKRLLASSGKDGTISIFTFIGKKSKPQILREAGTHPSILNLAFSPHQDNILAHTDVQGHINVWDITTSEVLYEFNDHNGKPSIISFNPRDNVLTSCGEDGSLVLHDLRTPGKEYVMNLSTWIHLTPPNSASIKINSKGSLTSFDFDSGGLIAALGTFDGSINIHDLRSYNKAVFSKEEAHTGPVYSLKWKPGSSNIPSHQLMTPRKTPGPKKDILKSSMKKRKVNFDDLSPSSHSVSSDNLTNLLEGDINSSSEEFEIKTRRMSPRLQEKKMSISEKVNNHSPSGIRRITNSPIRKANKRDEIYLSPQSTPSHDNGVNLSFSAIKNEFDQAIQDLKLDTFHQIKNLHFEMLRQFHIQQTEIQEMISNHGVNKELLDEIKRLREENQRLRMMNP